MSKSSSVTIPSNGSGIDQPNKTEKDLAESLGAVWATQFRVLSETQQPLVSEMISQIFILANEGQLTAECLKVPKSDDKRSKTPKKEVEVEKNESHETNQEKLTEDDTTNQVITIEFRKHMIEKAYAFLNAENNCGILNLQEASEYVDNAAYIHSKSIEEYTKIFLHLLKRIQNKMKELRKADDAEKNETQQKEAQEPSNENQNEKQEKMKTSKTEFNTSIHNVRTHFRNRMIEKAYTYLNAENNNVIRICFETIERIDNLCNNQSESLADYFQLFKQHIVKIKNDLKTMKVDCQTHDISVQEPLNQSEQEKTPEVKAVNQNPLQTKEDNITLSFRARVIKKAFKFLNAEKDLHKLIIKDIENSCYSQANSDEEYLQLFADQMDILKKFKLN